MVGILSMRWAAAVVDGSVYLARNAVPLLLPSVKAVTFLAWTSGGGSLPIQSQAHHAQGLAGSTFVHHIAAWVSLSPIVTASSSLLPSVSGASFPVEVAGKWREGALK